VRKICCTIILSFLGACAIAQSIAVINGKPVSQKEFLWVYQKHRPGDGKMSMPQLMSFLNIYIDFKLKVLDARASGLDQDSAYVAEVQAYEKAFLAAKPTSVPTTDYPLVINEYKEALLLFNISEKKIWNIMEDSEADIHNYYSAHSTEYNDQPYEDVKSEVAASYQKQLEKGWVTGLRNKYTVTIDQKTLAKLIR